MRNIAEFENFLPGSRLNEARMKEGSIDLVRSVALKMGVDPEELLAFVQADLEEDGMSEAKINEWIGGESIATIVDFFVLFPSIALGLAGLSWGAGKLQAMNLNKEWIKLEAEKRVKDLIKKDPNLIDRQEELVIKVAEELKNDPEIQKMLKASGGKIHPSSPRAFKGGGRSHIFGGGY